MAPDGRPWEDGVALLERAGVHLPGQPDGFRTQHEGGHGWGCEGLGRDLGRHLRRALAHARMIIIQGIATLR
jgi:hypothetical protein